MTERNNKKFCLLHHPDAKVRKVQAGTERHTQKRITYNIINSTTFDQVTAKTEAECWKMIRERIENKLKQENDKKPQNR